MAGDVSPVAMFTLDTPFHNCHPYTHHPHCSNQLQLFLVLAFTILAIKYLHVKVEQNLHFQLSPFAGVSCSGSEAETARRPPPPRHSRRLLDRNGAPHHHHHCPHRRLLILQTPFPAHELWQVYVTDHPGGLFGSATFDIYYDKPWYRAGPGFLKDICWVWMIP